MEDGFCDRNSEKCVFYFYVLLAAVSGVIMIHLGVFALQDDKNFYHFFIGPIVKPPLVVLICIGIVFVTIAFVFFFINLCFDYAAWRLLIVYTILALICLSLFDVFYAFYVQYSDFSYKLDWKFYESIRQYSGDNTTQRAWDMLQMSLKCCGARGPNDWRAHGLVLPESCFLKVLNVTSNEWVLVEKRTGCKNKLFYAFINSLYLAGLETGLKV